MKKNTKKIIAKINETKIWLFEKINKIDSQPHQGKRERTQINKIKNEKEVTTDSTKIQRVISHYYKQLYANKMDKLKEMDKFLERQSPKTDTGKSRNYEQNNHKHRSRNCD